MELDAVIINSTVSSIVNLECFGSHPVRIYAFSGAWLRDFIA